MEMIETGITETLIKTKFTLSSKKSRIVTWTIHFILVIL